MRIALYIDDGLEQIVLTPESETERGIVKKLNDGTRQLDIYEGQFYECRGGGWRQSAGRDSTIIVLRKPPLDPPVVLPEGMSTEPGHISVSPS